MIDRRTALGFAGGAVLGATRTVAAQERPDIPVLGALSNRRSVRSYLDRDLSDDQRSQLLWAAAGVNRPDSGGRTAPSWHGAADTSLYLADASGAGLYDPLSDKLTPSGSDDMRGVISPQPFVRTAPVVLIYVSTLDRIDAAAGTGLPDAERSAVARIDAAVMAQNVYLLCAALGLGTCLVGGIDAVAISGALGLTERQLAVFAQPVGWPA